MTQECDERKPRTILYSGSFDPPGNHNVVIADALADFATKIDTVWIIPYGGRPGKSGISTARDRREMILRAFVGVRRAIVDFMDLGRKQMTPNVDMDRHFMKNQPNREVWHVVGSIMIKDGASGKSKIHQRWSEGPWAFDHLNFIVLVTPDHPVNPDDLPPNHKLLYVDVHGTSQEIRTRVSHGEPIDHMVPPDIHSYICENGLYLS